MGETTALVVGSIDVSIEVDGSIMTVLAAL